MPHHGIKYFTCRLPPLTLWVERSKFNFFRTWLCFISNTMESRLQQHGSKHVVPRPPPPPLALGVKMSKFNISEHGQVAYQIKWNHECNSMVANVLPADTLHLPLNPWGFGQKVKIQLFQNIVMLHITLKGITNAATW